MRDIRKDTLSGIKWTAVERFSMQTIQFIIGIVLARILCPSDFGIVGLLTIFISLSNTLIDGGFSNALIRKLDCNEKDYSTAFFFNIALGLLIYLLLYLCSPLISTFFKTPILSELLRILAIVVLFNSLTVIQIAKLSREINFKIQAKATFISVISSGIFGIYLAYSGFGVWSLVWQQITNAAVKSIVIWYHAKWKPIFVFSKESFSCLFGYGSRILISNLIGTIYNQMSTILIGRFYTSVDLGYYTRGQQFAHLPTAAITDILGKVTFPILSRYQNDDKKLVDIYRKYISITSMIIFFLLTLLASLSKPIILILLSEKWENSYIFLQIFCFAFMFEHISKLNLNLLQVKGRSDLYLRLEIVKKIIAFSIMIISIPFGVIAICLSILVYSQFSLFINTYYTGKLFDLGYIKQFKDFSKYLILSILSCLPSYIMTTFYVPNILQIFIGGSMAILLYFIFLSKDKYFMDFKFELINKFNNINL